MDKLDGVKITDKYILKDKITGRFRIILELTNFAGFKTFAIKTIASYQSARNNFSYFNDQTIDNINYDFERHQTLRRFHRAFWINPLIEGFEPRKRSFSHLPKWFQEAVMKEVNESIARNKGS